MAETIPRLTLHERVQHGVLALAVLGALATGLGPGGAGARFWHLASGFCALGIVGYHALSLVVRAYVESRGWSGLPLAPGAGDAAAAIAEIGHIFGGSPARPAAGEYRVSQKLLYWWSGLATVLLAATGVGVAFWERFGTLGALPSLAGLHRGLALVLLAAAAWHLYGVFVWEGRWWPEWSWLTGELDAEKARRKVPGAHRRRLAELEELAAGGREGSPEERTRGRQMQEIQDVQAELERGNAYALEERFVEALHHYRRALELYPGYSQAMYNMARVLARMGEDDMAIETYRQFLEADPFHPLARKAQEAMRELAERGKGQQP